MDKALQSLRLQLPDTISLQLWPPDVPAEEAATLLIVSRAYDARGGHPLLEQVSAQFPTSLRHLRLALVTEAEFASLQAWGPSCQLLDWVAQELRQDTPDFPRLRSQVHPALNEQARLLRLMEQEFPNVGMESWTLALRLQALLERVVAWAFALEGQVWRGTSADWERLRQRCEGDDALFSPAFARFPTALAAFLERHRILRELPLHQYPENDREVDALLQTLQRGLEQVRRTARTRLKTAAEVRETRSRMWLLAVALVVSLVAVFAAGWWWTRPTWVRSLRNFRPPGAPAGITGYYYSGLHFKKLLLKRTDPTLDMVWRNSPGRGVGRDRFSVRWSGYLWIPSTGEYKLCFRHDDGGRLTVSNKRVSSDWRHGSSREQCRRLTLERGWHPLKAEMYESRGIAVAQLSWQKPGETQTSIVPTGNLCCRLPAPKPTARKSTKRRKPPAVRKSPNRRKPPTVRKSPNRRKP